MSAGGASGNSVFPISTTGRSFADVAAKLRGARDFKEEGNRLFKEGNFKKALVSYRKVRAFTRGLPGSKRLLPGRDSQDSSMLGMASKSMLGNGQVPVSDEEEEEAMELEAQTFANISTCYIRLEKGTEAQKAAKEALYLRPYYWKAHIRLAESQVLCKEFDEARESYKRAYELAPETEKAAKNKIANDVNKIKGLKKEWETELRASTSQAFGRAFGFTGLGSGGGGKGSGTEAGAFIAAMPAVGATVATNGTCNGVPFVPPTNSSSSRGSTDLPPTAPAT